MVERGSWRYRFWIWILGSVNIDCRLCLCTYVFVGIFSKHRNSGVIWCSRRRDCWHQWCDYCIA